MRASSVWRGSLLHESGPRVVEEGVKLLTYIDAVREAEKRSAESGQAIYIIPVHGFRVTEDIDDASVYSDSEVIRVYGPKHFAGAKP